MLNKVWTEEKEGFIKRGHPLKAWKGGPLKTSKRTGVHKSAFSERKKSGKRDQERRSIAGGPRKKRTRDLGRDKTPRVGAGGFVASEQKRRVHVEKKRERLRH